MSPSTSSLVARLWTDEYLERLSLVHGAIAVWHFLERDGAVEHAARLDATLQNVGQQLVHVSANGGRAAGDDDVAEEHRLRARDRGIVRETYAAHSAPGTDD